MSDQVPTPEGAYLGLRDLVLNLNPADVGLASNPDHPNVWGALMEYGSRSGVATLVALRDGTVSLYTSTGGGVIGAGEHESVRQVASRFLDSAETELSALSATDTHPLPNPDRWRFYVLTFSGTFSADVDENDVARENNSLHALFAAGQDVLTALRELNLVGQ